MKRALTLAAATLIVAGCQDNGSTRSDSSMKTSSSSVAAASPAANSEAAKSASSTAKPATAKVFPIEVPRKGNVYVFNSPDTASQFVQTKTPPANMMAMPGMGPNGETVYFESGPTADALVAEYQKLHPKK
jgi:hypothetical protein